MERLTGYNEGNAYQLSCSNYGGCEYMGTGQCNICFHRKAILEKLAAYEDTGLSPEHAAELAAAEKDERLVVLPCDIKGDTNV